ncbi:MAG: transporter substrate-binding protein [Gammaproteobacteria bacterium]|nr:transporter substrate-binding protein [Gammaproteobacteria bacterium]
MTSAPCSVRPAGSAWLLVILVLTIGSLTITYAHAQPISLTDDRGKVVAFAHTPQRIVTLLPSLTESVCELDACARLVGTDRYSNWPASVLNLPKLGGLDDAMLERIASLHPDVVLAGRSSRVIDRLEELGIPVVALEAKTFDDIQRVLISVARLLDSPKGGERLWRRIDAQIDAAAAGVPVSERGQRVYFEVSEAPYAAGAGSFIGELLRRLGLDNAVPADLGPFPKLNPEFVVRAQPDLIMGPALELASMAARPGWEALRALRSRRTCGFSAAEIDVLVRPGPRLGEGAELIVACVQRFSGGGVH